MKTIIDIILVAIVILIVAVIANALTHSYYIPGYSTYGTRYYTTQQVPANQNSVYVQQSGIVPLPQNNTNTQTQTTTTYYTQ